MTLVEVLAGLAILGTLLVSVLLAKARLARQWALAERRIEAVQAADALLRTWTAAEGAFPVGEQGATRTDGLQWRTRGIGSTAADALHVRIVRLEIFDGRRDGGGLSADEPLAAVELVLPREEPKDAE